MISKNKLDVLVFRLAKKSVKNKIKNYIEAKGISQNLWKTRNKLSFKTKYQKLKFYQEEVDVMLCSNLDELSKLYINIGLEDKSSWVSNVSDWYFIVYESTKSSKHHEKCEEILSVLDFIDKDAITLNKSRKLIFRDVRV